MGTKKACRHKYQCVYKCLQVMTLPKCCGCQKIALASTSALLNTDVRFQGC